MELVKKFEAVVTPDTAQRVYCSVTEEVLTLDLLKFKDGTIRVSCLNLDKLNNQRYLKVVAYVESLDDLMVCAQILDIVKRNITTIISTLSITSPIYSRYDRIMLDDKSDSFAAKAFSSFVDSCGYDIVEYVDCHSNVLVELTRNSFDREQKFCVSSVLDTDMYNIVAPDKGAIKKNPKANLVFDKKRELSTGKILGIELINENEVDTCKEFLVVDDLCEGGGTFLGLITGFEKHFPTSKINLYVTHGLFTNNAIEKLLVKYSKIFVYIMKKDVYDQLTTEQQHNLVVKYLVK